MLQHIHDKITGWIAGIVIVLIGVPFIFWGVDVGFGGVNYAARVNGEKIAEEDVRQAFQNQLTQYQQATRSEVPAELRTQLGNQILDSFILAELLEQHTREQGYRATDEDILRAYQTIPDAMVGGKFDAEAAKRILLASGVSMAAFEAEQRARAPIAHLRGGIASSSFVTPAELQRQYALEHEEREAAWAIVPAALLAAEITPTEDEIKAYYEANKSRFMTPETLTLRYVELKVSDIERTITVDEQALRAAYEERKESYTEPERRRARHILFQVGEGAEADAAARKKADDALARLNKGEDFARLAKELSEDAGSAEQGGDLDWQRRGDLVGPFEDALFSMKVGEVRGPVRTEFGYHIIRLDAVEEGKQKSFEEVRAELEQEYRREQAEKLFGDRQEELETKAFENLDSLEPAAEAAGVPIRTIENFTRQSAGPFQGRPEILEAAFSKPVLVDGENSEPIELEPGHVVVLRAENVRQPEQKPLEAVRSEIVAEIKRERGQQQARARGEQMLAQLEQGKSWSEVLAEAKIGGTAPRFVTRIDNDAPPEVRQALFNAPRPEGGKPEYLSVALANGDYAVVSFMQSRTPVASETPQQRMQRARQLAERVAAAEITSYVEELKAEADIDRNPKLFE